MNYYNEIKNKIIDNEVYSKVKDYSKERHRVITYYEIGKLLSEAGKHYGEGIIKEYSKKLTDELGKGYTFTALTRMRKLFVLLEKLATVSQQLSYGHYVELLPYEDINKVRYYIKIIEEQNLSIRQVREKIKNKDYERLPNYTRKKLINKEKLKAVDFVKNPIIIKNSSNCKVISEKVLQRLILEDISSFLKELGPGFTYIDNEYRIKLGNRYNYIDLLLFNYEYNCFVVVELKVTELKKEHIGQIQVYMNYIDTNLRKISQDKTIGIIVCKQGNKYIIEYCSDKRIISRTYEIVNVA